MTIPAMRARVGGFLQVCSYYGCTQVTFFMVGYYTNTQGGAGGKTITIGKNNVLCESTKQTKSIFIEKFEKNICMQKVRPACK